MQGFLPSRSHSIRVNDRLVFPLDVKSLDEAETWVSRLQGIVGVFKVGLELFTRCGPEAVALVRDAGAQCFLDLKLHDIPATMEGAALVAAELEVDYLTVHVSAGPAALVRTSNAVLDSPMQLLGVTVLTSLDDTCLRAIGFDGSSASATLRLATLAHDSGLQGLVCSPHDCQPLRHALGPSIRLVTPGVRPRGTTHDDQRRAMTPEEAIVAGSDLLVVGRPIRNAVDPEAVATSLVRAIARGTDDDRSRTTQ